MNEEYRISKRDVRRAFSASADDYDAVAVVQREVRGRMLERLDYIKLQPQRILDLGCGTGGALSGLRRRYRKASLLALDMAEPMLHKARKAVGWWRRPHGVCADMEALPLAPRSVDMVFSNFALQWSNDLDLVFAQLRETIAPGGLLMFSTFGPDTLRELRHAWLQADPQGVHVNAFMDMHDIGDALVRAGFSDPVMDVETITLTYKDVRHLMSEIKQLGAHNVTQGRLRGLTGKGRFQAMLAAYEALRLPDGGYPLSYEVVYGSAWVSDQAISRKLPGGAVAVPISMIGRK